jgi:hypothetical protein
MLAGVLRDGSDFKLFGLQTNGVIYTSFGFNGYLKWGFAGSVVTSTLTRITELSADCW